MEQSLNVPNTPQSLMSVLTRLLSVCTAGRLHIITSSFVTQRGQTTDTHAAPELRKSRKVMTLMAFCIK